LSLLAAEAEVKGIVAVIFRTALMQVHRPLEPHQLPTQVQLARGELAVLEVQVLPQSAREEEEGFRQMVVMVVTPATEGEAI
jgi:hypothetical protein